MNENVFIAMMRRDPMLRIVLACLFLLPIQLPCGYAAESLFQNTGTQASLSEIQNAKSAEGVLTDEGKEEEEEKEAREAEGDSLLYGGEAPKDAALLNPDDSEIFSDISSEVSSQEAPADDAELPKEFQYGESYPVVDSEVEGSRITVFRGDENNDSAIVESGDETVNYTGVELLTEKSFLLEPSIDLTQRELFATFLVPAQNFQQGVEIWAYALPGDTIEKNLPDYEDEKAEEAEPVLAKATRDEAIAEAEVPEPSTINKDDYDYDNSGYEKSTLRITEESSELKDIEEKASLELDDNNVGEVSDADYRKQILELKARAFVVQEKADEHHRMMSQKIEDELSVMKNSLDALRKFVRVNSIPGDDSLQAEFHMLDGNLELQKDLLESYTGQMQKLLTPASDEITTLSENQPADLEAISGRIAEMEDLLSAPPDASVTDELAAMKEFLGDVEGSIRDYVEVRKEKMLAGIYGWAEEARAKATDTRKIEPVDMKAELMKRQLAERERLETQMLNEKRAWQEKMGEFASRAVQAGADQVWMEEQVSGFFHVVEEGMGNHAASIEKEQKINLERFENQAQEVSSGASLYATKIERIVQEAEAAETLVDLKNVQDTALSMEPLAVSAMEISVISGDEGLAKVLDTAVEYYSRMEAVVVEKVVEKKKVWAEGEIIEAQGKAKTAAAVAEELQGSVAARASEVVQFVASRSDTIEEIKEILNDLIGVLPENGNATSEELRTLLAEISGLDAEKESAIEALQVILTRRIAAWKERSEMFSGYAGALTDYLARLEEAKKLEDLETLPGVTPVSDEDSVEEGEDPATRLKASLEKIIQESREVIEVAKQEADEFKTQVARDALLAQLPKEFLGLNMKLVSISSVKRIDLERYDYRFDILIGVVGLAFQVDVTSDRPSIQPSPETQNLLASVSKKTVEDEGRKIFEELLKTMDPRLLTSQKVVAQSDEHAVENTNLIVARGAFHVWALEFLGGAVLDAITGISARTGEIETVKGKMTQDHEAMAPELKPVTTVTVVQNQGISIKPEVTLKEAKPGVEQTVSVEIAALPRVGSVEKSKDDSLTFDYKADSSSTRLRDSFAYYAEVTTTVDGEARTVKSLPAVMAVNIEKPVRPTGGTSSPPRSSDTSPSSSAAPALSGPLGRSKAAIEKKGSLESDVNFNSYYAREKKKKSQEREEQKKARLGLV